MDTEMRRERGGDRGMSISFPLLQQMPEMVSHGEEGLLWLLVSEFSHPWLTDCTAPRAGEGRKYILTAKARTDGPIMEGGEETGRA